MAQQRGMLVVGGLAVILSIYFLTREKIEIPSTGLIGDLNDDGVVDLADLDILELYIAGYPISQISPLSDAEFLRRADVNGDGRINGGDITALEILIGGL